MVYFTCDTQFIYTHDKGNTIGKVYSLAFVMGKSVSQH